MTGPNSQEIALRLAKAGPQWRPTADAIEADLVAYLRHLYPNAPSGVAENYGRAMVGRALQKAAQWRAASGDTDDDQ